MGDPVRPLLWVSKSHAKLAAALRETGHKIADSSIPKLLGQLEYRRQVNRKTLEGSHNPDRNAQFEHINAAATATQAAGQPVISIDTKKKELVGPYRNGGSNYHPEGCPDEVNQSDTVVAGTARESPSLRLGGGSILLPSRHCCILMPGRNAHAKKIAGHPAGSGGAGPRRRGARAEARRHPAD